jgi:hypothetical protein
LRKPSTSSPSQPSRADFEQEPIDASDMGKVERSLGFAEKMINNDAVRRLAILFVLALIWELYARWVDSPLILPTLGSTLAISRPPSLRPPTITWRRARARGASPSSTSAAANRSVRSAWHWCWLAFSSPIVNRRTGCR